MANEKQEISGEELLELAAGRWFEILTSAGIDAKLLDGRHHECPICGGKDRFRWDNHADSGLCFCNQVGKLAGLKVLSEYLGGGHGSSLKHGFQFLREFFGEGTWTPVPMAERVTTRREITPEEAAKRGKKLDALYFRKANRRVKGSTIEKYFNNRGLIESDVGEWPGNLKLFPKLTYVETRPKRDAKGAVLRDERGRVINEYVGRGEYDTMLAPLVDKDQKIVSLHRTYLQADATALKLAPTDPDLIAKGLSLAGKKVMAATVTNMSDVSAHIPLYSPDPKRGETRLGVGEGIETVLSGRALTGLPVWAAYSSGLLAQLNIPLTVTELIIFADNDAPVAPATMGIGLQKAIALAERYMSTGMKIYILLPSGEGLDWNDVWQVQNEKLRARVAQGESRKAVQEDTLKRLKRLNAVRTYNVD